VALHGGKLDASLAKFGLYGGFGDAVLHADASGSVPAFTDRVVFTNVQMAQFLSDTIGVSRIEGTGTIRLNVSSGGTSASDVMHAMRGSGSVQIRNGDIRGVDLGMVARTIQTVVSGGATSSDATTRFSSLHGTFAVHNGIVTNRDLNVSGPGFSARGQGLLDLGNRMIDFHIVSKAGGAIGLSVPVHVTGTWDHLHYTPDLVGTVGGVIGDVAEGGATAVKSLIPGGQSSGQKKSTLGDSVKSLFGIH
jgi:AsmA protein